MSTTARRLGILLGCAACVLTIVLARSLVLIAVAAVLLAYLSSRSPFDWIDKVPVSLTVRKFARRMLRSLVFLVAVPFVPAPVWRTPSWAVAAAIALGLLGLLSQRREIQQQFQPRVMRLYPPISSVDRTRDVLHFLIGGAAQEYLYRHVVVIAFQPLVGWWVVVMSVVLFMGEHWLHHFASWDTKDMVTHGALALGFVLLVLLSGSLLPAVLAHTIYNAPNVVFALKRPGLQHAMREER